MLGDHGVMDTHDELIDLAEQYWDSVLEFSPSDATLLGDHRFDDRIEDYSPEADRRILETWHDLLTRVRALDVTVLSGPDRTTRDLLYAELDSATDHYSWRPVELASDQMDGVHARLLTAAPQLNAPRPENAEALVRRFRQFGVTLGSAAQRFREGLTANRTPARVAIERSLNQLDGYLASDPTSDPFVILSGPADWDGETDWRTTLSEVAREVIRPAFHAYRQVLAEELLPVARPDDRAGLCWLGDDGEDIYRRLLRRHTTLSDLTAQEIHEYGLSEIDRLRDEYAEIGGRLFGTSDADAVLARLRSDPDLRYRTGEQIMADARAAVAAASAEMPKWFGRLPIGSCEIVEVPEFLAADAPGAYYFPPASDGSRPGTYFVNLHEPQSQPRFQTAAVAYHEAIPGHHLQLAIAGELQSLPRFQRESLSNTAFVEGWALYTERLADEMGLYATDLDRLGMLAADSHRSCRLVVDTGLHAKGWSREQALNYMIATVPIGLPEIRSEIDRYIAMPGQAVAYKIGQREIRDQRTRTEQHLGAAFDIKTFHDTVLGSGTISLPVLGTLTTPR